MMSHALAQKLMELPNQYVYIHPSDPERANAVTHLVQRLNGIVLMSQPVAADEDEKGGRR